jgi:hypothetical protein
MFMKVIYKVIFIFLFFLVISFSIANSETVKLGIWPFENKIIIPLFFFTLVSLTLGIFIGLFIAMLSKNKKNNH